MKNGVLQLVWLFAKRQKKVKHFCKCGLSVSLKTKPMNSLKKTFVISTAIISFVGCTFHTDKKEPDTRIDFTLKKGNILNSEVWKCKNIEDEKICIPSSWNIMEQKKVFFLSKLDNNDINSYFVVTKYNKIVVIDLFY